MSFPSSGKQLKLTEVVTTRRSPQVVVDKYLIDLICQGLFPFQTVELPAFRQFIHVLQPNVHIMSLSTLKRKLEQEAVKMRLIIKAAFRNTEHIATTTDCWTTRRRSFIGLTANWINQKTLKKQSAALACKRLKGSHTFDVLATAIDEIHSDYGIRDKVIQTTTDNGSNFIKVFSSHQYHHNTSCSATEIDCSEATIITSDSEESDSKETAMEFYFEEAFATFEMSTSLAYKLPRHQRCACHLLHLVACKDALSAESDSSFKKLSRFGYGKLNTIWNKVEYF